MKGVFKFVIGHQFDTDVDLNLAGGSEYYSIFLWCLWWCVSLIYNEKNPIITLLQKTVS